MGKRFSFDSLEQELLACDFYLLKVTFGCFVKYNTFFCSELPIFNLWNFNDCLVLWCGGNLIIGGPKNIVDPT